MLNEVILQGRLTKDPEYRVTSKGGDFCSFTIAVEKDYKNVSTGKRESDFIGCTAFGTTAKFVSNYFKKGSGIIAKGDIHNNDYTDKSGNKQYSYNVNVRSVFFELGGKDATRDLQADTAEPQETPQSEAKSSNQTDNFKFLDDLGEYEDIISDGKVPF